MNHGYHITCKMMMEGVEVPFRSAVVSCNPNGVEMNIDVHPSDKIFDLKTKTSIQILYRDWIGAEENKKWRLLGEGYFSAFGKFDSSQGGGNRGITLMCRDFRMDIRKTPSSLMYNPNETDLNGESTTYMSVFGLDTQTIKGERSDPSSRAFGGENSLKNFSYIMKFLAVEIAGAKTYLTPESADGQQLLDALSRGIWMDSLSLSPYSQSINSRTRLDKKLVVPQNRAGYNFLSEQHMGSLIQGIVYGQSMFSSVESVIMRIAAIFQVFPYSCSTPNLIDINLPNEILMSKGVWNKISERKNKFGDMSLMNSCMLLPPLNFTAPPNCNIIFPGMITDESWTLDRDADITRGHFVVHKIFDDLMPGEQARQFYLAREMPVSTIEYYKTSSSNKGEAGGSNSSSRPFLTLEERYAGVNMMYGNVEMYSIYFGATQAIREKYFLMNGKTWQETLDNLKKDNDPVVQGLVKAATANAEGRALTDVEIAKLKATVDKAVTDAAAKAYKTEPGKPTIDDLTQRHAYIKYMNARFAGRTVSVQMDFNPYVVAGMPGIVLVPTFNANDKSSRTMRHLYGMVQIVKHTVSAAGEATTAIVLSSIRFLDEPSKIDDDGCPLYCDDTVPETTEFDSGRYDYSKSYSVPKTAARAQLSRASPKSLFAYGLKETKSPKWAADLLLHDGDEDKNYHYMDRLYMPYQIGKFYEAVLGMPKTKHFMLGRVGDKTFMYDTIEEAATRNLIENEAYMHDYEAAMTFAKREVISEDDYYVRIMGAAFPIFDDNKDIVYTNVPEDIKDMLYRDSNRGVIRWYGFPTKGCSRGDDVEPERRQPGLNDRDGDLSSIIEKLPITPFIVERRRVVEDYKKEVEQRALTSAR